MQMLDQVCIVISCLLFSSITDLECCISMLVHNFILSLQVLLESIQENHRGAGKHFHRENELKHIN